MKNGRMPRNWSAWMAAKTAAIPARIARMVTPTAEPGKVEPAL